MGSDDKDEKKLANRIADTVGKGVANLGDAASGIVSHAGEAATNAASEIADHALSTAKSATDAINKGFETLKGASLSAIKKRERIKGFEDGINQGVFLATENRYNYYYAYIATICYFLRCDGDFCEQEEAWLRECLDHLAFTGNLPDDVFANIESIASNESLSFEDVKERLDKISIVSLEAIAERVQLSIEVDDVVTDEEQEAEQLLSDYLKARMTCVSLDSSWYDKAVEKSVREYSENIEKVNRQFKELTKLQDEDAAFLMGATALQVLRVIVINALTEIEKAGQGKKEDALHKAQEKILKRFDAEGKAESKYLYASLDHIIKSRGVPYDATKGGNDFGLFKEPGRKGANHRFATLGHDPLLGLIFGTSNIMTNSISCIKNCNVFGVGVRIPTTNVVLYDPLGKNPEIGSQVLTTTMLASSGKRVVKEPEAAAASLIKQLIHIGTDLYTPLGIQIPFANLVLDKSHAEKLTQYISTGDILKVGVQAGMAVLINWLVAALHGSMAIFDEGFTEEDRKLRQVRTKKIVLMSNIIATSSSVVLEALRVAITKQPKCNPRHFDIGGAAVLVYRLFTDIKFIAKVKEDYIDSELDKIYDERAKGLF